MKPETEINEKLNGAYVFAIAMSLIACALSIASIVLNYMTLHP